MFVIVFYFGEHAMKFGIGGVCWYLSADLILICTVAV